MASSIVVLKSVDGYSLEQTALAFKKAIIESKMILKKMESELDSNQNVVGIDGTIEFIDYKNDLQQFYFTINNAESEGGFDWLVPEKKLFWAFDIEDICGYPWKIFCFSVKYFSENPNDYLWVDSMKWAYSAEDIERLSRLPYNPKWLCEKM